MVKLKNSNGERIAYIFLQASITTAPRSELIHDTHQSVASELVDKGRGFVLHTPPSSACMAEVNIIDLSV